MLKTTKVTVASGLMRKEFDCDFFAGLGIMQNPSGSNCDYLIAGTTDIDGIITALRMLKNLEDQLYDLLPVPRKLVEPLMAAEDALRKADGHSPDCQKNAQASSSSSNSSKCEDPFLRALLDELFPDGWDGPGKRR